MSKLISEADKLLEKGKIPEAIDKLKSALKDEPLNQLVANKLANIFVEEGEIANAAKIYVALAHRLSEAGKSQVAIAIYKQALELTPLDIDLKVKFAVECEAVGKLSDAQIQANLALQYYLRRKKYFDATNILPLLARVQTKDEKIKAAWIEIIQLSQAEQKLVHLLVAICGPPGLVSEEFPKGGDPATISESLYESLKKLVPFFPRDPKIAYAVAWAAHRRGKDRDFYHYLRECIRREPDFCLALLLLARILAESQKLSESLFVYKHTKERLPSDRSTDMLSLTRLLEGFVEKNGWITFTEGMGMEELDAEGFVNSFKGGAPAVDTAKPAVISPPIPPPLPGGVAAKATEAAAPTVPPVPPVPDAVKTPEPMAAPPAGIELSLSSVEDGLEVQLSHGGIVKPLAPPPAEAAAPAEIPLTLPPEEPPGDLQLESAGPLAAPVETVPVEAENIPPPAPEPAPKRMTFNPLENLNSSRAESVAPVPEEKTQMFSPMEILGATNVLSQNSPSVETKQLVLSPESLAKEAAPVAEAVPPPFTVSVNEALSKPLEGTGTQLFSPVDAVQAGENSRKPYAAAEADPTKALENPPSDTEFKLQSQNEALALAAGEVFAVFSAAQSAAPVSLDELATAEGEATQMIPALKPELENKTVVFQPPAPAEKSISPSLNPESAQAESTVSAEEMGTMVFQPDAVAPSSNAAPVISFVKIPDMPQGDPVPAPQQAAEGEIDLGDDLIDGPTRALLAKPESDATAHLFQEIEKELKEKKIDSVSDVEYMWKKAERYIAKRNYYLARKALRHTLALGGDEEKVKMRLREIRKLEMPDGLYHAISSDEGSKEGSGEILDRLEEEFDLRGQSDDFQDPELNASLESKLESIFLESDARTILDFGVALHEMGLFRQAESVFSRLVDDHPETAFDAYYLAAVSKLSRKDYAGAASILKKLSADGGKTDLEKIQIYYALGELFQKMRRPEKSREFFKKVAELDSNYRNIRHKLEE